MKKFKRVIPLVVVLACAGVGRADGELPRPYVPDIFRKGETILFIGDSLTDGNHGGDMNHYLGHGFAADIAMRYLGYRPELGLHFANRGKGGENSAEVRARWERDAIPYTPDENGYDAPYPGCKGKPRIPDWLNILVGFNDGWSVKRLKPAQLEENGRLARSVLVVTSDANPDWSARKWTEYPAEIRGDVVLAELPEGACAWYFAVELDGGALVSSPVHGAL